MIHTVTASLETLAAHVGLPLNQIFCEDGIWHSTAPLYEANQCIDLTVSAQERPLSCLQLGPCHILDGYFPVVGEVVLFNWMHHNGDLRASRYTNDAHQLTDKQEARLKATSQALPNGPRYFHLGGKTDNLWHYFYNILLRLAVIKHQFGTIEQSPYTFVMPTGMKPDFYRFAAIFGLPPERCRLFDDSQPLYLPNLTITQTPFCLLGGKLFASRSACDVVRLPEPICSDRPPARRIYLSRADARWRRVLNEDEFRPALEARGFQSIQLTNFTADDLAALMSDAECVIGPSGANLAATFFCPKGCRVIEFSDRPMIEKYHFQIASAAGGLDHRKLLARAEETSESFHRWHVSVPADRLVDMVDSL